MKLSPQSINPSVTFDKWLKPHEKAVIDAVFRGCIPDKHSVDKHSCEFAMKSGLGHLYLKSISTSHKQPEVASLQKNTYQTLFRNSQIQATIQQIANILSIHHLPFLFLKGSVLAFTCYDELSDRPMSDIDVLIGNDSAQEAYNILVANGARETSEKWTITGNDHHLPPLILNGIQIEIHQTLFPINARYQFTNTELFAQPYTWSKKDFKVIGPKPSLLALYVAVHMFYTYQRGGLRLSWLYDLKVLSKELINIPKDELIFYTDLFKLHEPIYFTGWAFELITDNSLANWPLDSRKKRDKRAIRRLVASLRAGEKQKTSESYGLIIEQIRHASGYKAKLDILKNRLTKNGALSIRETASHTLNVGLRFVGYVINSLLKLFRLK